MIERTCCEVPSGCCFLFRTYENYGGRLHETPRLTSVQVMIRSSSMTAMRIFTKQRAIFATMACFILVSLLPAFAVEEKELRMERRPSSLHITEDGAYLIAVSNNSDKIHVVDPVGHQIVSTLNVRATGPIISRDGKLFVAESQTGLVKIFQEGEWQLINEIDTGVIPLTNLSAKSNDSYDGTLLASNSQKVHVVEVAKDAYRLVGEKMGNAVFSIDGAHVIHQAEGKYRAFATDDYLRGNLKNPADESKESNVSQPLPLTSDLWYGPHGIYVGLAPSNHMGRFNGAVVAGPPAEVRKVYLIEGKKIDVRSLDDGFSLLESIVMDEHYGVRHNSVPRVRHNADGSVSIFFISSRLSGLKSVTFKVTPPIRADKVGTQMIQLPPADTNELVTGPEGTTLSDEGLSWTPASAPEPGRYNFKVKQTTEGKVSFFRESLEILPAEEMQPRHDVRLNITPGSSRKPMLHEHRTGVAILDKDRLLVLDTGGRVKDSFILEKSYHDVVALDKGFAIGRKKAIDLLDEQGKLVGTIPMKAVDLVDIELGANSKVLYASCKDSREQDLIKSFPIYAIDLKTKNAKRLDRAVGTSLAVNPAGDQLLSFISQTQLHYVGILDYVEENTNVLMGYRIVGDRLQMKGVSEGLVSGIRGISYSADGSQVAVNSHGVLSRGRMTYGLQVPVFASGDLEKPERMVPINGGGMIQAKFHPKLDWLCVLSNSRAHKGYRITAYDGDGVESDAILSAGETLPAMPEHFCFSPDGTAILVTGRDKYGRKIVSRLSLSLSAKEKAICAQDSPQTKPAYEAMGLGAGEGKAKESTGGSGTADGVPPSVVKELVVDSSSLPRLNSELMAAIRMPSVVIVTSGQGSVGAGFFVSGDGHIVTAAHCLPSIGNPMVSHYLDLPFGKLEFQTPATVLEVDEELDLALIKIDFNAMTSGLKLAGRTPGVGARVFAIGHPGVEQLSLNYTLTEGLVSSDIRKIEGRSLLQISAAVNPGNSGGPVLDEHGCVIGMVTQKAQLEGASFAIPAKLIASFIEKSKASTDPKRLKGDKISKEIRDKGWRLISELIFTTKAQQEKPRAHLKGKPDKWFTGTLVVLGNPSDHLFAKSEYKDGYLHGDTTIFDSEGRRIRSRQFEKGEENGIFATYYASGNYSTALAMKQGLIHGYVRNFNDKPKSVKSAAFFVEGEQSGPTYMMDELGRVVYSAFYSGGKIITQSQYNHRGNQEGVPINEFTRAGDLSMLKALVADGAKINELHNKEAPIHIASKIRYTYMIDGVIELGGDVDLKNGDGKTALQLAMSNNPPVLDIAKSLINHGADKSLLTEAQQASLEADDK